MQAPSTICFPGPSGSVCPPTVVGRATHNNEEATIKVDRIVPSKAAGWYCRCAMLYARLRLVKRSCQDRAPPYRLTASHAAPLALVNRERVFQVAGTGAGEARKLRVAYQSKCRLLLYPGLCAVCGRITN